MELRLEPVLAAKVEQLVDGAEASRLLRERAAARQKSIA